MSDDNTALAGFAPTVVQWQRHAGRHGLPWQGTRDPYRIWLSEIMLQQTQVATVIGYYQRFLQRFPTVQALAQAEQDDVMPYWAGLGYYARARNLLACARAVAGDHGGVFPDTEAGLLALPGVGAYTAAAVAAIAFDRPANVVDGNVERVMARLFAVETPLPAARPALKRLAARFVDDRRPGDWAQALMDLGATVCRPKSPLCGQCPIAGDCAAFASGAPERFPVRAKKPEKPRRHGVAHVIVDDQGRVALERRPDKGLLGGMLGLPTSDWSATPEPRTPPFPGDWRDAGTVEHVFTHFALTLHVRTARARDHAAYQWMPAEQARSALPTVFAKALDRGLAPDLI